MLKGAFMLRYLPFACRTILRERRMILIC